MKRIQLKNINSIFDSINEVRSNETKMQPKEVLYLDTKQLAPGKFQPRRIFDEKSIDELSISIKQNGILQPILVRKNKKGDYDIIAGERRWRAATKAGLASVPCIETVLDDQSCMAFGLLENIQRESLTPIEESLAYKKLIDDFGLTHNEISERVGKSRAYISNSLRLLSLPEYIQKALDEKLLTVGHAKVILGCAPEKTQKVFEQIVEQQLSVRQTELLLKKQESRGESSGLGGLSQKWIGNSTEEDELCDEMIELFGCKKAKIVNKKNIVSVTLDFRNFDKIKAIIERLREQLIIT